jgi:hypothetical protein
VLVAVLRILILADFMAAPLGSVTVPKMVPRPCWATAENAASKNNVTSTILTFKVPPLWRA